MRKTKYHRHTPKSPRGLRRGAPDKYSFNTLEINDSFEFTTRTDSMRVLVCKKNNCLHPKRFQVKIDPWGVKYVFRVEDARRHIAVKPKQARTVKESPVRDFQLFYANWAEKHGAHDGLPILDEAIEELAHGFMALKGYEGA